jgi:hypothetical protein
MVEDYGVFGRRLADRGSRAGAERRLLLDPTAAGEPANSMRKLAGINDQMFGAK